MLFVVFCFTGEGGGDQQRNLGVRVMMHPNFDMVKIHKPFTGPRQNSVQIFSTSALDSAMEKEKRQSHIQRGQFVYHCKFGKPIL